MRVVDAFMGLQLDDAGLLTDAAKMGKKAGDSAGGAMSEGIGAKLSSAFKSGGVLGLGMGAGIMAFNALGASVQGAVGFMEDAVRAAGEDEASQAKLRAALQANAAGWDGNTAAIEDVIKARMRLGFTDEEQRDSLAVLVAKTGDVTQALAIQAAAMDLARLKGTDLAAASKAIALGMGGQGRALKELGIDVKDYASANEILAAIQGKAAGQAEAFGNSTQGALDEMNVAIGEATENIGYKLTPVVKKLAEFARDDAVPAVVDLTDSLGRLGDNTGKEVDGIRGFVGWLNNMRDGLLYGDDAAWHAARAAAGLEAATVKMGEAFAGSDWAVRSMGAAFAGSDWAAMGKQIERVGTATADATRHQEGYADGVRLTNDWTVRVLNRLPELAQAFRDTAAAARANRLDAAYGLAELPLQIAVARDAVKAAALVVKENPLSPQAKIDLLEAQRNLDQYLALLKAQGPNAAIIAAGVGKQIASGLYQGVLDWRPGAPKGPAASTGGRNIDIPGKAAGGPVSAGMPYWVGENRRPELFVPGEDGRIVPSLGGPGGMVADTVIHTHVELEGREIANAVSRIQAEELFR